MSLKKPTEFFGKNNNKKEEITTNLPENLGEYKSNLKNIEVLNEFTENFGSFADNITKINSLEEGIQELKEELKNTLTQDDLDNAVMSNLLILEKNIDNIQKSLKGINRENLKNIYEEVENISNQVLLVTEELPRYKNLIKSNEVSLDKKLVEYQESVNENLTDFSNFIDNKFDSIEQSIENSIEGINESALNKITTNVKNIEKLVNTEIPRHKKQVTEKVIEIDEKFSSYQKNIENYQEEIQLKIQEVQQSFETLFENEVPKYQSLLANAKIENDKKVESIVNKLTHKIKALAENTLKLNEELEDKSNVLDQAFETKISALESYILNAKKEAEETTQTYRKLYQVIEAKGLSDRSQFDTYEKAISHISSQFSSVYEKIEETKKEIEKKELYQEELNNIQESFNQKFIQVETLIENKNQKLKEANKVLVDNIVSLKEEVSKISVSELHQNYQQISRKVNYIEEVFSKFNDKTVLNESILPKSTEIKTKDPLTPLDQNFVTLDQLQSHYRLFINRIQQQLSTIGGGGETRLEFLDDVDRNSAKTDGYVLAYQASTGKFIGTAVSGGGSQTLNDTLGLGNTSSLGMSVGVVTATSFTGSGTNLTGIVTSIIAGTNVTISGSTGQVTINASGGGGGSSQWVTTDVGIHTFSNVGIGTTNPTSKLHVVGDARITGILTIGTSSIVLDGTDNKIYVGSGVTISSTEISIGSNIIGSGGFSGNASSATFATNAGIATFATSSGIATFATNAGIATFATSSGIATFATNAGIATFATNAGIATFATNAGIATYATNAGIATFATSSGIATFATNAGIATFATNAGIATFATNAGIATYATNAGIATFATNAGIATSVIGGIVSVTQLNVSGISTFTSGPVFIGAATSTGTALQILQVTGGAYVSGSVGIGTTNPTSKLQVQGDVSVLGIITATQLSTGASGTGINISTDTISGPSLLYIDPAAVGDNTGAVRIKGDLYVDGTQFIVNSTTIEFADFNVGIATTVGTNALLDGAGIGIGSTGIRKTLTWNNSSTALKSSEDFDVASGKVYKINGTSVLSNNTLGSDIVTSSLTSVGTLTNLSVGNVNSSGIVTATTFVGALTGNVTGNLTGEVNSPSFDTNASGVVVTGVTTSSSGFVGALTGNVTGNVTGNINSSGVSTVTSLIATNINASGIVTATSGFVGALTGNVTGNINSSGVSTVTSLIATNINASGIVTTSSLRGYSALVGTASSTTTTFVVTVASKTSNHRYFGNGSGSAYFIDGIESPFLTLLPGKTYRFTQEDGTNSSHPILFYYQADKTTQYTTNVTTTGTPGSAGAYTEIVVTDTTPVVLHYQCSNHGYMGNAAQFSSSVVDTPYQITARSGINVTGVVTATTFVGALTGTATIAQGLTGSPNLNVGVVTATSFNGSGTALTGIVTSIIAGTNVTVSGTGQVTINASGGGGSSQWITTDVGIHTLSNVGIGTTNPTSKLTVVGVVSATSFSGSGIGLTSIPAGQLTGALPAIDGSALTGIVAGGSGVVIRDDGSPVGTATTIDFGANLSVSFASGIATITASGGGSQTLDTTLGLGNTSSLGMSVGVVTATSFSGSGIALTGIVTSIIAGTNITVSGSTGQVTINSTASGGGSSQWVTTDVGIHTLSNVGIGTTNPTSALTVVGVVSATSFSGSGAGLTNIPANIGISYAISSNMFMP